MSRYELRILLTSWGLLVDLDLSAYVADNKPPGGVSVAPGVSLVVVDHAEFWEGDLPRLLRGLRRVAPRFQTALGANGAEIVFRLDHLWYPLTDSQEEAIELAVAGWAAGELGIPFEPATVAFDRETNRYMVEFNEDAWKVES